MTRPTPATPPETTARMGANGDAVSDDRRSRKIVPPFGWPLDFRAVTITPAVRHPLIVLNRYPRQVIGFAVRLPDDATESRIERNTGKRYGHHRALSIMWAKPARWWK